VEFPSNISAQLFLLQIIGGHIDEYLRIIA
jgi:hypothetical protein